MRKNKQNLDALKQKGQRQYSLLRENIREAAVSVLPVIIIVLVLCFTFVPVSAGLLVSFLIGSLLVIVGMGLFTLGAERAMSPIGSEIGTVLTKSKSLPLILCSSFLMGFAVTIAEPDLQVLAQTVPHINSALLIGLVGVGVGLFMMLCMLRILKGWKLRTILLAVYIVIFILSFLSDSNMIPVAFDSGGVTTGPMTVPFILALGIGVSNIRSDQNAEADSFGLVGLSSAGPILVVLILGFFYHSDGATQETIIPAYDNTAEITWDYLLNFPSYLEEMAVAMLPVVVIFLLFQISLIRMTQRDLIRIFAGLAYTYVGLVLFLTGVNVGFSIMGSVLGAGIVGCGAPFLLIPIAMILGRNVISAEPAVAVLEGQIEDVSAGSIPGSAIRKALHIAMMLAMGFSALRVLTGIDLLYFLIPGYAVAFVLSFLVPDVYTAIAFDSGGVASGPMTASFLLSFIMGACQAAGGNILHDAFGVVSLVAMMPLVSIQVVGLLYSRKPAKETAPAPYADYNVVELW